MQHAMRAVVGWLFLCATSVDAFTASSWTGRRRPPSSSCLSMAAKSVVVVSPPGGVGEVTAVKAATMGGAVKWFVVSSNSSSSADKKVAFPKSVLADIEAAGGSVELAGAEATSLLQEESTRAAASTWCGQADAVVCCLDGTENAQRTEDDRINPSTVWKGAVKVAAREACKGISGTKLAILSVNDGDAEVDEDDNDDDDEESGGLFGLFGGADNEDSEESQSGGGLFSLLSGGAQVTIPSSLLSAMGKGSNKLRHGQLFGIPESSTAFSPFEGGPLKSPTLCEEYRMRNVRVDPTLSVSGNSMMESSSRSSRLAVGEAAALVVMEKMPLVDDVCVTSLRGTDVFTTDMWEEEFGRVMEMLSSGKAAQLFTTAFASVPDVERLADWIATKWAPAVLRTYDIAAIRIGARPVYASRTGPGQVEVVWQQLQDDFDSVTAGKMIIQVSETGIVATRGAGDASKGFGQISRKPLQGESVLVRRLADAASQAIEKGLAERKKVEETAVPPPPPAAPATAAASAVTSLKSVSEAAPEPAASLESGPRRAGVRRSTRRTRGTRKQTPSPDGIDTAAEDSFQ